jgi:long-chain acyl-CoA synthetase
MSIIETDHLGKLFLGRIQASPGKQAITFQENDTRIHFTWREVYDQVVGFAQVIWKLNARPGDRVALFAENRFEWVCADLALHLLGIVHVPIHASLTGHQAAYQMLHSGARIVIFSGKVQAEKVAVLKPEDWVDIAITADVPLKDFQSQIHFTSFTDVHFPVMGKNVETLAQAIEFDKRQYVEQEIDAILANVAASDLATILYTSGTTGEPKGVMLTHGNLTSNAIAAVKQLGELETDLRLNFLPLSHVFARTCDLYTWIVAGSRLELARSRETAVADLRAAQPTILNTVPFFLERIYRYLADNNLLDSPTAAREMMGGNLRLVNSGGAALPNYLYDYFNEHGVPLFQGYGLSETSPIISCCGPGRDRRGSAGKPIPGIEVKISGDGEIITRGPHVMPGYYRNEAATKDVIKEGWFHTGDLGRLDDDGFLYITGRKKEIIVLSSGKNISPALIEGHLLRDPMISQVTVFGDGQNFLVALIVPNWDRARSQFGESPTSELIRSEACRACYADILCERLAVLSPHEQIKAFALLENAFSIDAGEMTAKMSLRRNVIAAHYRQTIDALFLERSKNRSPDKMGIDK